MSIYSIIAIVVLTTITSPEVNGHGMMIDPANRASRWRYGFPGPREYTDNQLSCGGRNVQWAKHKGKCGVCGDEFGLAKPRFAYPGAFATDAPIVRVYNQSQKINAKIKITANHKGYFKFRVAPLGKPPIKQHELDEYVLKLENGTAGWQLTSAHGTGVFNITLQLSIHLTCKRCVLQWWWATGNNFVNDEPETFINCADIEIRPRAGNKTKPKPTKRMVTALPPKPSQQPPHHGGQNKAVKPKPKPTKRMVLIPPKPSLQPPRHGAQNKTVKPKPTPTKRMVTLPSKPRRQPPRHGGQNKTAKPKPTPTKRMVINPPKPSRQYFSRPSNENKSCRAVEERKSEDGMDLWCQQNCSRGFCPESHCICD